MITRDGTNRNFDWNGTNQSSKLKTNGAGQTSMQTPKERQTDRTSIDVSENGQTARQANRLGGLLRGLRYLLVPALLMLGGIGSAGAVQISLTSNPNPSLVQQAVQITATVSGGDALGTVYFYECPCGFGGETLLGTVDVIGDGTAVFNYPYFTAGTHNIGVSYVGSDIGGTPLLATLTQDVVYSSITTLSASPNSSTVGQAATLTATVTTSLPPGTFSTVTFNDGATVLGTVALVSGRATLSYAFSAVGSHSLTASYAGDSNNAASTSTAVAQTVNPSPTTTTLTTSSNPSAYGAAVTLTATVSGYSPSGTVTFKDGATVLGTGTIAAGQATFGATFNTAGSHSLTAVYGGDAKNVSSISAAVAQTVNKAATTTTLGATPNPSVAGQAVTLTAAVTGATPTGTVTFKDGTTVLGTGTLVAGQATLSYAFNTAGSHSLTAVYGGDAKNVSSISAAVAQTVNKSATTTTLGATPNPSVAGQAVTLTAAVTGATPTGTVTFKDGTTVLGTGTISAGSATFSVPLGTVGTHSLTAVYGGDANNTTSTSTAVAQTVNPAATSTALSTTPNPSSAGQAVTLTAAVTGAAPTGTVTFRDGTTVLGTGSISAGSATFSVPIGTVGTHSLTAVYGGDANNTTSTSTAVAQTVNPAAQAYYIHTDHLDTPRQITDTAGNVVWDWQNLDPFGNNMPNENPSGLGKFEFDMRFPGQVADKETGLFYNIYRDYDPNIGRYIESDPIGLEGGSFSTYTYVDGDPLSYIDPEGLARFQMPRFGRPPGMKPPRWSPNRPGEGKPTYKSNPQHDPKSSKFVPGKTPEPANCPTVYKKAVPDDPYNPRHWWGRNDDGKFYRFSNTNDGTAHYSGTFDRRAPEVPPYVRSRLGY